MTDSSFDYVRRIVPATETYFAVPTYVGAGNIVTGAAGFYSLRGYAASSIGSRAIRIADSAGANEQDINIAANGRLDENAIVTWGHGTAYVKVLYDQSGNGKDATAASGTNQRAVLVPNKFGPYSAIFMDSTLGFSQWFTSAGTFTISQAFTVSHVTISSSLSVGTFGLWSNADTSLFITNRSAVPKYTFGGSVEFIPTAAQVASTKYACQMLFSGAGSAIQINSVSQTGGNVGTGSFSAQTVNIGVVGAQWDGYFTEIGFWPGDQSASFAALEANQRSATNGWNF